MQQVFSPPPKASLNNDVISVICQFLDLEDAEINKTVSQVNREFHTISCSDKYWSRIIQKWEQTARDKDFIEKVKDSKQDYKKTYINTKRRHFFHVAANDNFSCTNFSISSVSIIVAMIILFGFAGLLLYTIIAFRPVDYCSRQVNYIDRERGIDVIPSNGSCISCSKVLNYSPIPLLECQFDSTNVSDNNPISYPCCLTIKNGDKCVHKIVTNIFYLKYKVNLSTREKLYESSVYECSEGFCDLQKLTNYTGLLCRPYQNTYVLDNQSNSWKFQLLMSISFFLLIVALICGLIGGILFCINMYHNDFLSAKLEKDSWFRERIEDGIVYIQPKKDIHCHSFLKYLKLFAFNRASLKKKEENNYHYVSHYRARRPPRPVVTIGLASR